MKYPLNHQPFSWNQTENSTQNSSSNFRYFIFYLGVISNKKYEKDLIVKQEKTPFILLSLAKDHQQVHILHKKMATIIFLSGKFLVESTR